MTGTFALVGLVGCDVGRRDLPPIVQPTATPIQTGPVVSVSRGNALFPGALAGNLPLGRDDLNRLAQNAPFQQDAQMFGQPRNYDKAVTPPECQPVLHALQNKAVSGVDFSAFQQVQFNTNDQKPRLLVQIAVIYQSPEAAKSVFDKVAGAVAGCEKDITEDGDTAGQKTTYQVAVESNDPGKTRWDYHQKDGSPDDGYVLEARLVKNLVYEVVASGPDADGLSSKVAEAIAAKAV